MTLIKNPIIYNQHNSMSLFSIHISMNHILITFIKFNTTIGN